MLLFQLFYMLFILVFIPSLCARARDFQAKGTTTFGEIKRMEDANVGGRMIVEIPNACMRLSVDYNVI